MLKKIPIVGCPIGFKDLLSSLFNKEPKIELKNALVKFLNSKYIYFANSATASFYSILEVLKERCDKKEVILPAYTASSLIIAIKKANLRPVLCDISLDDFNMDMNLLDGVVNKDTLCIVGAHMFGIVAKGLEKLKERFPDVFIMEDCAQSLGSKVDGKPVGNSGEVSFFSFNRGKNLPTYGGGCIATNSDEVAGKIEETIRDMGLGVMGKREEMEIMLKMFALSLVVRPCIYGMLYPLIFRFKEKAPSEDFEVKEYTDCQAGVALALLKRIDEFSKKRYDNGMRLIGGLKDREDIIVPEISEGTEPAFNRLPIVFKDLEKRGKVEKDLWKAGIETSRMYFKPLHHVFELGYKKEDFPNAVYFAERLLTLPVHPLVDEKTIIKMIDIMGT